MESENRLEKTLALFPCHLPLSAVPRGERSAALEVKGLLQMLVIPNVFLGLPYQMTLASHKALQSFLKILENVPPICHLYGLRRPSRGGFGYTGDLSRATTVTLGWAANHAASVSACRSGNSSIGSWRSRSTMIVP